MTCVGIITVKVEKIEGRRFVTVAGDIEGEDDADIIRTTATFKSKIEMLVYGMAPNGALQREAARLGLATRMVKGLMEGK